ncbi:hypothetical protein DPF_1408 [Desulfoplanes formicivorans]|uniref:Uncharacterized protein n=1 Tax=Desulfoplanes formicivorans TaxID=1592317 RepID=A0A194AF48_9BACT|nr:hypothetical protein DPF_1408 [Desulfoplanes formicivorans]
MNEQTRVGSSLGMEKVAESLGKERETIAPRQGAIVQVGLDYPGSRVMCQFEPLMQRWAPPRSIRLPTNVAGLHTEIGFGSLDNVIGSKITVMITHFPGKFHIYKSF